MRVILDIPNEEIEIIKRNGFNKDGTFSFKLNEVIKQAIRKGVILPDNATNGDVIKALFPSATVYSYKDSFDMYSDVVICPQNSMSSADRDFWKAPYKGGQGVMAMTIDDSERYLKLMLGGMKYAVEYWKDRDKEESDIEQTNVEAVKTALDTMRKYQKITKILNSASYTENGMAYSYTYDEDTRVKHIREVIEDGKA